MEWSERMNTAISYIEDNLDGEIDYRKAAEKACCSLFHFQRMFFAIIGVTPAEYIRRRRLTLAARELTSADVKVIDVALKYGYDSPDSFTRAFRNVHGISPQAARRPGVKLAAFPRISFYVSLKGRSVMDYKLVEKPAFDVIGTSKKFTTVNKENLKKIPQFWSEFKKSRDYKTVCDLITAEKETTVTGPTLLGVCIPNENKNLEEFFYAIGVESSSKKALVGFETIYIPALTWAIFDANGPAEKSVQEATESIYQEWFPSTGYEEAAAPELEVYPAGDTDNPDYRCQIWVPINKKKKR
jgi:AraC family transcriptional regulator